MDEVNKLKEQVDLVDSKIKYLKDNPPDNIQYDEEEIRNFYKNFPQIFENGSTQQRKKLIRTFVRQLELDPEKEEIRVSFYPDHIVHSIGVGGGT